MSNQQFTATDPRHLLPRRFIVIPGVVSPLTCRHPKHVRCNCHHPQREQEEQPKKKASTTSTNSKATRELELTYQRHLSTILFALRSFPEASAAVNELLRSSLTSAEDEDDEEDDNAPFPC